MDDVKGEYGFGENWLLMVIDILVLVGNVDECYDCVLIFDWVCDVV